MGLFNNLLPKKSCPICGKKLPLIDVGHLADATICGSCEKKLRGKYLKHEYVQERRGKIIIKTRDELNDITLEEASTKIMQMRQKQEDLITNFGQNYTALFSVEDTFIIAPKFWEVGIRRVKRLKNRKVAKGFVISGRFAKGDIVDVIHDGQVMQMTVLEVHKCTGQDDFITALNLDMCKSAKMDENAWLILEGAYVTSGDVIGKQA